MVEISETSDVMCGRRASLGWSTAKADATTCPPAHASVARPPPPHSSSSMNSAAGRRPMTVRHWPKCVPTAQSRWMIKRADHLLRQPFYAGCPPSPRHASRLPHAFHHPLPPRRHLACTAAARRQQLAHGVLCGPTRSDLFVRRRTNSRLSLDIQRSGRGPMAAKKSRSSTASPPSVLCTICLTLPGADAFFLAASAGSGQGLVWNRVRAPGRHPR
jgi:hypothetical protein